MVTAIIVNYFSSALCSRAALSILTDQPDAQVIVVDNSSNENEFVALRKALPVSVACLNAEQNLGFGRACNLAFEHAKYDWILLLNPDAYVLNGCIAALVAFMHEQPQAGAVAPLVFWDRQRTWLLPPAQLPTPARQLATACARSWRPVARFNSLGFRRQAVKLLRSEQAVAQEMLSGGHMLLRKAAITAAGGLFDRNIFMFYEDTDLCLRLRNNGYRLYLLPAALAVHEWCCRQTKNHLIKQSYNYYFQKHFSGSRLSLWAQKFGAWFPVAGNAYPDLGTFTQPPLLPVPQKIQKSWLLELSPLETFIPALYRFGHGPEATLTEELWQRLDSGEYFFRLGEIGGKKLQSFRLQITESK